MDGGLRPGTDLIALLATLLSPLADAVAYEYLAESIPTWPDQPTLANVMAAAGWARWYCFIVRPGHRC